MFRSHENVTLRRNNITFRRANIKSRRNNWKSQCKNMFPQRENITPQRKKIFPQRENITQQRKNIISQCKNIIPQQENIIISPRENKNFQIRLMKNQRSLQYSQIFDWKTDFLALRTTLKYTKVLWKSNFFGKFYLDAIHSVFFAYILFRISYTDG